MLLGQLILPWGKNYCLQICYNTVSINNLKSLLLHPLLNLTNQQGIFLDLRELMDCSSTGLTQQCHTHSNLQCAAAAWHSQGHHQKWLKHKHSDLIAFHVSISGIK